MAVTSESRTGTADRGQGLESFAAAWDEFFAASRRARGRAAKELPGPEELTLAQFQLLVAFRERTECSVRELAEAAAVAPPTATRMLDGLERGGIAERRPSETDRRAVSVRLTPKGRRLLRRKYEKVERVQRDVWGSLRPAERREAIRTLKTLAGMLDRL